LQSLPYRTSRDSPSRRIPGDDTMIRLRQLVAPLAAATFVAAMAACEVTDRSRVDTLVVQQPSTGGSRAPATPRPTPPRDSSASGADSTGTGTLTLKNQDFASVNVEVRLGKNADCGQNAAFGTRQLKQGETWTITTGQDVCWRRDANPVNPNGQWTGWNRQAVAKGTTHEANL
jgi:hypothetical protein